ncbi:hypothetical protein K438DRAFT_351617 [Mycena galopus ATCC 62051]|nr:hypothetical protein K438DRAFT_351617 [Mycena galopus ATCC 62051]
MPTPRSSPHDPNPSSSRVPHLLPHLRARPRLRTRHASTASRSHHFPRTTRTESDVEVRQCGCGTRRDGRCGIVGEGRGGSARRADAIAAGPKTSFGAGDATCRCRGLGAQSHCVPQRACADHHRAIRIWISLYTQPRTRTTTSMQDCAARSNIRAQNRTASRLTEQVLNLPPDRPLAPSPPLPLGWITTQCDTAPPLVRAHRPVPHLRIAHAHAQSIPCRPSHRTAHKRKHLVSALAL